MVNFSDDEVLHVYKHFCIYIAYRDLQITLNILHNEASKAVKRQIIKTSAKYQLLEPQNYCSNIAKKAIQTFQHHFITGFPLRN